MRKPRCKSAYHFLPNIINDAKRNPVIAMIMSNSACSF